jgi:hypothetical protein
MIKTLQEFIDDPELSWIYHQSKKEFTFEDAVVIFTGKGNIYTNSIIAPQMVAHEETHIRYQNEMGTQEWWEKYFTDIDFKYQQELEAHRNEYKYFKEHNNRDFSRWYLHNIVLDRMNGSLYKFPYKTRKQDIVI